MVFAVGMNLCWMVRYEEGLSDWVGLRMGWCGEERNKRRRMEEVRRELLGVLGER